MSMTDPIADLLTRMRNAGMAKHETVDVPWSRLKENIVKVLVEEGYVRQSRRIQVEGQVQDTLRIQLKYDREHHPVMSHLPEAGQPPGTAGLSRLQGHPAVAQGPRHSCPVHAQGNHRGSGGREGEGRRRAAVLDKLVGPGPGEVVSCLV